VTEEVEYLSAMEESRPHIAQANAELDEDGKFEKNCHGRQSGRTSDGARARGWTDGRVAEAAGFGCGGADSVPGKRRRQPRPDGLEHAASGRAAGAAEAPLVGTGMEALWRATPARPSLPAAAASSTRWTPRVSLSVPPKTNDPVKSGVDIYTLQKVPALQPEHLHQPASAGEVSGPTI
jgi:DNA-directed RNA polymerase subunit beta